MGDRYQCGSGGRVGSGGFVSVSSTNGALFAVAPAVASDGTLYLHAGAARRERVGDGDGAAVDDGGTADGGVDTSVPQTFTITVVAVNDAPSFTAGADQSVARTRGRSRCPGGRPVSVRVRRTSRGSRCRSRSTDDNPALFAVAPAVASDGTLTYTPRGARERVGDGDGAARTTMVAPRTVAWTRRRRRRSRSRWWR